MANLKLLNRQPNGVTYANPNDVNYTVRFKHSKNSKNLSGVAVANHVCEIIVSDLHQVIPATGVNANDALSVRVRISGSEVSAARLQKIAANIGPQLSKWVQEGVFVGFEPTTLPTDVA